MEPGPVHDVGGDGGRDLLVQLLSDLLCMAT
jgi:hypothetical protein